MTAAEVRLWGTKVGTVSIEDGDMAAKFEYDSDFIKRGVEVSPVTMPLNANVYSFPALSQQTFQGLPGMLADSLPDRFGNAVINKWLESQGRQPDSLDPVEKLCYIGKRGMGALEYFPVTYKEMDEKESINVDRLIRLASNILSKRKRWHVEENEAAMSQIIKVGTSAGGARAKAVIAWNEETGDICSGQTNAGKGYGYWIIKFADVRNNGDKEGADKGSHTVTEYAYHKMAVSAGIEMSECRLYEEKGRKHFMTRRFDRRKENGEKLHMQTLGAMAHFDYNTPGIYSYEQAAAVMRMIGIGQKGIEQLYRRMVFNIFARNQDDHVKNISFLMDKNGEWSLSPAYDVTYAYNPRGKWTGSHQMTMNGKREEFEPEDFLACASSMSIKREKARSIMEDVRTATGKWMEFAEESGLPEEESVKIGKVFRV